MEKNFLTIAIFYANIFSLSNHSVKKSIRKIWRWPEQAFVRQAADSNLPDTGCYWFNSGHEI